MSCTSASCAATDEEPWDAEKIREEFEWINVPLPVEFGLTKIDGSWYGKTAWEPGSPLPEEKQ